MFFISNHYFVTVLWISSCVTDSMLFLLYYCNIFLISLGYTMTLGKVSALWKVLVSSKWRCSVALAAVSHVGNFSPTWHSWADGSRCNVFGSFTGSTHGMWILPQGHVDGPFCGNSSPWRLETHFDVFSLVGWLPRRLSSRLSPERRGFPARLCLSLLHTVPTSQFCRVWKLHPQTPAEVEGGPWVGRKARRRLALQTEAVLAPQVPAVFPPFLLPPLWVLWDASFRFPALPCLLGTQTSRTHSISYSSLVYFLDSKSVFLAPPSF